MEENILANGGPGWGLGFPDPFMDAASLMLPRSMSRGLRYCEAIFQANGLYRQAIDRVLSYFITEPEVDADTDEDREKWENFFGETLDLRKVLHSCGADVMAYGNGFVSVLPSFRRYLMCKRPKCGHEVTFAEFHSNPVYKFAWANFEFHGTCPRCKYSGAWTRDDREDTDPDKIRIVRWSPHEIEIRHNRFSDRCQYLWKIPEDLRRHIKQGSTFHLEDTRWEVIEAIQNNHYLLFDEGFVFHMKEDALAGTVMHGWGLGRAIINFRQAIYVQLLHRYNEAIVMDYVIPFRVITPAPSPAGGQHGDPLLNQNLGGFMGQVRGMLARRRRDPAAWNTLPFPIQYQAIGGDARTLAPKDLLDQGQESLLNAIGVPVELFKGSLSVQAAPAALRLFEASWGSIPSMYNGLISFIVDKVSQNLSWEPARVSLTKVAVADDLQRQQTKLQLMASGQVSPSTGLKSVGIAYRDEVDRLLDDQRYQQERQAELTAKLERASSMEQLAQTPAAGPPGAPAAGGAAPPQGGGDPSQAGGPAEMAQQSITANLPTGANKKVTPEEMWQRAQYLASQLLGMPEAQKDSELIRLKKLDPMLHSQVRARMDDLKQQMRTQGGAQMQAQMFGKAGSAPKKSHRSLLDGIN